MKDREKHFTGSTLTEIFDELDDIAMVLDNGLAMLAVLEGTGGNDIPFPYFMTICTARPWICTAWYRLE